MTDRDFDLAPDAQQAPNVVRSYLAGFFLAALLTAASFWAVTTHSIWSAGLPMLLAALAISQMGVHLVFFFHISSSPDRVNSFLALAFGVFVVGLVVFGSMIIMANLNANMSMGHAQGTNRMMNLQTQP
jgi:cytochrome o ubiquinol oxidase operon protein cyoD